MVNMKIWSYVQAPWETEEALEEDAIQCTLHTQRHAGSCVIIDEEENHSRFHPWARFTNQWHKTSKPSMMSKVASSGKVKSGFQGNEGMFELLKQGTMPLQLVLFRN